VRGLLQLRTVPAAAISGDRVSARSDSQARSIGRGISRIASAGLTCPVPADTVGCVLLGHGSGGKLSAALLAERFLTRFGNDVLGQLGDAAIVEVPGDRMAVSTDSFVVSPLEFPGGNIGHLAVHGTVNDLAMMGAEPLYLSAGFILEEGLPFDVLDRVLDSMAEAASDAGVIVVTGDTKVVERGKADGMFIKNDGNRQPGSGVSPGSGSSAGGRCRNRVGSHRMPRCGRHDRPR